MNKTLLLVIAALLVLATAGGATAGNLITSKQIKNGTIKPADLSKSLRKTATAPTAPAAPGGFTKVIRVASTAADTSVARCPAGTTLVGGGGISQPNSPMSASYPDGNAWRATPTNFPDLFTTYALCAS